MMAKRCMMDAIFRLQFDARFPFRRNTRLIVRPFGRLCGAFTLGFLLFAISASGGRAEAAETQLAQGSITDRVLGIFGAGDRPSGTSPGIPPAPPTALSQEDQRCVARPTPTCVADFLTRAMEGIRDAEPRAMAADMLVPLLVEQRQLDRLREIARQFSAGSAGVSAAGGAVLIAIRSNNDAAVETAIAELRRINVARASIGNSEKLRIKLKGAELPFPEEYFKWAASKGRSAEAIALAQSQRGQQVDQIAEYSRYLFAAGKHDEARLIMEGLVRAEIEGRQRRESRALQQTPRIHPWSAMFESNQAPVTQNSIFMAWNSFDPYADGFNLRGVRIALENGRAATLGPSDRAAWLYNSGAIALGETLIPGLDSVNTQIPAQRVEALNFLIREIALGLIAIGDLDAATRVLGWEVQESAATRSDALKEEVAMSIARAHLARRDLRAYAQLIERFPRLMPGIEPQLLGEMVAARNVDRALQVARNVQFPPHRVRYLLDLSHALFLAGDARLGASIRDEARTVLAGLAGLGNDLAAIVGKEREGSVIAMETEPAVNLLRLADRGDIDELLWDVRLQGSRNGVKRLVERKDSARLLDLLRVSTAAVTGAQGPRQTWLESAIVDSAEGLVRIGQAGPAFRELDRVTNAAQRWELSLLAIGALADLSVVTE